MNYVTGADPAPKITDAQDLGVQRYPPQEILKFKTSEMFAAFLERHVKKLEPILQKE